MYTATADFQIPLRFSLQPLVKDLQVAHTMYTCTLFLPKGIEMLIFALQAVLSEIQTWPVTKDPEVTHILPF